VLSAVVPTARVLPLRHRGGSLPSRGGGSARRGCREAGGRGPTKVRVTIAANMVTIIYEEGLTPAEKKLVVDGDPEFVRLMRRRFQDAVRFEVVALVERVLGRRARTFLSDHDVVNDIGLEVILLEEAFDSVERPSSG
jgi:uncharacterized protein YbcI